MDGRRWQGLVKARPPLTCPLSVQSVAGHSGRGTMGTRNKGLLATLFEQAGNTLLETSSGYQTTHHPLHDSSSGKSLHIYPDRGHWRCWACEEGGGVIAAVESLQRCDRKAAEAWLRKRFPLTVERLAEDKGLPVTLLKKFGLTNVAPGVVSIPYQDEAGATVQIKRREAYTATLGSKWP